MFKFTLTGANVAISLDLRNAPGAMCAPPLHICEAAWNCDPVFGVIGVEN